MQIRTRIKTVKPENEFEKSLDQELLSAWFELSQVLNGGLKFEDNFNLEKVNVANTGLADTEFSVAHSLKRVPLGYLVISRNKAAVIYDSGTAWTSSSIFLKSSLASANITVLIF